MLGRGGSASSPSTSCWVCRDQSSNRPMSLDCRSSSSSRSSGAATGGGPWAVPLDASWPLVKPVRPHLEDLRPPSLLCNRALSPAKRSSRRRSSPVARCSWKHSIMAAALHRRSCALPSAPSSLSLSARLRPPLPEGSAGSSEVAARGTAMRAAERIASVPAARPPSSTSRSSVGLLAGGAGLGAARSCCSSCRLSRSAA
mmetsp:Transcript_60381/g.187460  ORF Transcript_60381/g.187460 Transcript_60381/m.187460 type:complete len:200 (-) Transcript_60381:911-1510(-)